MKLKNLSKKTTLSIDLKRATSILDQLFGLLRQSNPRSLLFKTRFGIHTFFLKEKIDVIILDQNFKVVKLKTISPNSLFFWNPKYNLILELPKKTIKNSKTQMGNQLKILNS